jgi:hypothetical protein
MLRTFNRADAMSARVRRVSGELIRLRRLAAGANVQLLLNLVHDELIAVGCF